MGAFVAGVAAGSGDRVEVWITCPIDSVLRWNSGPGTKQRGKDPGTLSRPVFEAALETRFNRRLVYMIINNFVTGATILSSRKAPVKPVLCDADPL